MHGRDNSCEIVEMSLRRNFFELDCIISPRPCASIHGYHSDLFCFELCLYYSLHNSYAFFSSSAKMISRCATLSVIILTHFAVSGASHISSSM